MSKEIQQFLFNQKIKDAFKSFASILSDSEIQWFSLEIYCERPRQEQRYFD